MILLCYSMMQIAEIALGLWLLYQLYPERRKQPKWLTGIVFVIFVMYNIICVETAGQSFLSNTKILIVGMVFAILYTCCFQVKLWDACLTETLFFINIAILKLPMLIGEGLFYDKTLEEVNRGARSWAELIWYIALFLVIVWILRRKRKLLTDYMVCLQSFLSNHPGMCFLILCVQWGLLTYNMWLGEQGFHSVDFMFNLILIFCMLFGILYLMLRLGYQELKQENRQLDIAQELLQKQNDEMREIYVRDRERVHKMSHDMVYLDYCVERKDLAGIKRFIHQYREELQQGKRQVWTGLPFLDFFLNYKKQTIDRKQIALRLDLDVYSYPFQDAELGVVLGNLLDNAIEACEKCEVGKREIYLGIWNINKMFVVNMKNSSSKEPVLREQRFLTDKEDKNAHGLGVEQVKRIINRYEGEIDFYYDSGQFEVSLLAPNISKEEER